MNPSSVSDDSSCWTATLNLRGDSKLRVRERKSFVLENLTCSPLSHRGPGSYGASRVCLSIKSGCIMLDLPELLAPARIVRGRISMLCSLSMDLKPETLIPVMPEIASFLVFIFRAKTCTYGFA